MATKKADMQPMAEGLSILGESAQSFSVAARRLREATVSPGATDEVSMNNLE